MSFFDFDGFDDDFEDFFDEIRDFLGIQRPHRRPTQRPIHRGLIIKRGYRDNNGNINFGRSIEVSDYERPITDFWEEKDHIIVITELPGVKEEDIYIDILDNRILRVKAPLRKENDPNFKYYNERSKEGYYLELELPSPVSGIEEKTFVNGVLQLKLKKKRSNVKIL